MKRSVLLLGFPGIQALDLVGPAEVFAAATLKLASHKGEAGREGAGYDVIVVSTGGAPFATGTGLAFAPSSSIRDSPRSTSSGPTRCCATCPTPKSVSCGTNPARSPPTPAR